jgi:D-beta-D-heptose 7-phosphate kinase/D-beta-D-heptose 1-phosphate adenosyltransferase
MKTLESLLERISQLRMLVIGDLMLDRYIFGDASRISPGSTIPTIFKNSEMVAVYCYLEG